MTPNVGVQPRPKAVGWNNGLGRTRAHVALRPQLATMRLRSYNGRSTYPDFGEFCLCALVIRETGRLSLAVRTLAQEL
jgi:hypothetical protein